MIPSNRTPTSHYQVTFKDCPDPVDEKSTEMFDYIVVRANKIMKDFIIANRGAYLFTEIELMHGKDCVLTLKVGMLKK